MHVVTPPASRHSMTIDHAVYVVLPWQTCVSTLERSPRPSLLTVRKASWEMPTDTPGQTLPQERSQAESAPHFNSWVNSMITLQDTPTTNL